MVTYTQDPVLTIQERSDRDDRELFFDVSTHLTEVILKGDGYRGAERQEFVARRFRSGEEAFVS